MCVLGKFKSHRTSVDCLWQRLTAVSVYECVCVCVLVTLSFPQSSQL